MALSAGDFKTFLTSGNATGSDGGGAQADPDDSLGGWRSTTEMSLTAGNLWTDITLAQQLSSTLYRCVALTNVNATDVLETCHIVANFSDTLDTGITMTFGMHTNDTSTVAPVSASETAAPATITFFTPGESTGVDNTDYHNGRPLGPLNADSDDSTELTYDDDKVIFLYIKAVFSGANAGDWDGTNDKIGSRNIGVEA